MIGIALNLQIALSYIVFFKNIEKEVKLSLFAKEIILYRSLLLFYTLIMKYKKEKLRNNIIYYHVKKDKIPRNKPT